MTMPSSAGKVCVMCGEDVAARPRTKDPRGRYFCEPCYASAVARKQSPPALARPPLPKAAPMGGIALEADDEGDRHRRVLEGLLGDAPASPAAMNLICPSCRMSIPAGGFLCTNCGHNLQTGAAAAHTTVRVTRPSGGVWPGVVGGISMLFGGVGTLLYCFNLVSVLSSGSQGARLIGGLGGAGLTISLSLWLLVAGLNIVRKQSAGVSQIKRWAIAKLVLCVVCVAPVAILAATTLSSASSEMPEELRGMGSALTAYLLLIVGWLMFWPIFVLAWFSRAAIQNDVDRWD